MGTVHEPEAALLFMAVFSRHTEALAWAEERAGRHWGPAVLCSERFAFTETAYYEPTMGGDLKKCFLAFPPPFDAAELAARKCQTNDWERAYAALGRHAEPRPLNLDPGYLTLAKLVLATTKDRAHRIYLARGIYAEVTLTYHQGAWRAAPWTYPDYRSENYHAFFTRCREHLKRQRHVRPPA